MVTESCENDGFQRIFRFDFESGDNPIVERHRDASVYHDASVKARRLYGKFVAFLFARAIVSLAT